MLVKKWLVRLDTVTGRNTLYLALDLKTMDYRWSRLPTLFDTKEMAEMAMDHPQTQSLFLQEAVTGESMGVDYRSIHIPEQQ